MSKLYAILGNKQFLWMLLVINVFGTVYGYYWYVPQLVNTPAIFLPFVPDSPTASLFFVFVLIAFLLKTNWPLMEALAIVTLFKYGIWAVIMNILVLNVTGNLHWSGYMLMASHFAMAVEGMLYAPYYRFKLWHLIVAAIVALHNEMIDYVFMMMPNYQQLDLFRNEIGYFTFWLSILSIGIAYYLGLRKNRVTFDMKLPR
ncbi:DUF1405 domain-containing protein [Mesobacillus maritimus]|uniref:DUF1405 domain-containing protein n=1 Tax=Mesobacillus maritimus TaxID=1643336 RepID=UPI003850F4D0